MASITNRVMSLAIHYYDQKKSLLVLRVLGTFGVDDKTASVAKGKLENRLETFELKSKLKIMVTDNASAMKSAFKDVICIGCSAHNLNLVHKYSYGDLMDGDHLLTITSLIDSCKKLVAYV